MLSEITTLKGHTDLQNAINNNNSNNVHSDITDVQIDAWIVKFYSRVLKRLSDIIIIIYNKYISK